MAGVFDIELNEAGGDQDEVSDEEPIDVNDSKVQVSSGTKWPAIPFDNFGFDSVAVVKRTKIYFKHAIWLLVFMVLL